MDSGGAGAAGIPTLYTVGHGTLAEDAFTSLLERAQIRRIADVRSFPGSRHNPQFRRESMELWVPAAGLSYVWIRELGGRRRSSGASKNIALRNEAFRAYADHMNTAEFQRGSEQLLELATGEPTTVMCSESVWWRCHRRLLADFLVLVHGVNVVHLMHDGRLTPHVPTAGVRLAEAGLIYDVGVTSPLTT
jgi:uncharacterized protein (DUF488 family)